MRSLGRARFLAGEQGCLYAVTHLKLLQNVRHVVLDSLLGEEELRGDLLVRFSLGDLVEDCPLPVRKIANVTASGAACARSGKLCQQASRHRGSDVRLATAHGANDLYQLVSGHPLEDVAVRAVLQSPQQGVFVFDRRQDDDFAVWTFPLQSPNH